MNGYLGNVAGTTGTATVTGSSASWANSTGLYVGNFGTGALTVSAGGSILTSTGTTTIGNGASSTGAVTVTGTGSNLTGGITSTLTVGNSGTGTLNVLNGATTSVGLGYIGYNATGTGTVNVDGAGSTFTTTGNTVYPLYIGYSGKGTLNVSNSGAVTTAGQIRVGQFSGSSGTLSIASGGTVSAGGAVYVGAANGSTGVVTIDGSGSKLSSTNSINVGEQGKGTLTIENGGAASLGAAVFVGNGATGNGTLLIQSGGTLTNANGLSLIGNIAGSVGTVTVTGAGSKWTNSGSFSVAANGTGTLNIDDGGVVSVAGANIIGQYTGSKGAVTVDGSGSTLTNAGFIVGASGSGTLTVSNSAKVSTTGSTNVGFNAGGNGSVLVESGGSVTGTEGLLVGINSGATGSFSVTGAGSSAAFTGGATQIGINGAGTLLVEDGASLTSDSSVVAQGAGSTGTATVTGVGSTWNAGSSLIVGSIGTGSLTVSDGAVASAARTYVGTEAGGTGAVTVSGTGSTLNSGNVYLGGGIDSANGGTASLTITNNGLVSAPGATVYVAYSPGSTASLNIGANAQSAAATAGKLDADHVVFGQGAGTIVFNHTSDDYVFSPAISGPATGTVNQLAGITVLTGANTYLGATNVTGGTLRAGVANTFSTPSAYTVGAAGTLDTAGFNQTVASINNSGTVSLASATAGSTLTVTGAYVGNGGVLKLGTVLGDSSSASDRLVLDGQGASATGSTRIQISNVGGLGALTTGNGIAVVSALNGATTAANAFTLSGGHVDAGAYEYRLYDGGDASGVAKAEGDENWYLRSSAIVVPATPATPTSPGTPAVTRPTYRAEVPLYAALPGILRQGDLSMLSTLHRRVGDEASVVNASSPAVPNTTRAWGRLIGGNTTITQSGTTAPESRTSTGGFQTGVDLYADPNWNAGLYVGKLRSDATVRGVYGLNLGSTYAGSLRADTTYLGGYATYANANGLYVDTVLQYGIQDITGHSTNAIGATADGKSLTASVEVGQRFAMGANWALEPQAQLIYNRQNIGNSWIGGLTTVDQDTANAVIGRLGIRMTGDFSTGLGRFQPYARLNLWHGFSGTDSTGFLSPAGVTRFDNKIGYTSVEVAAGATLALTSTTSVYGEVGSLAKAWGQAKVKSGLQGSLGVKLRF